MKSVKLSTWAKNNNYSYHGAYKLFKNGGIPNATQLPNGTILVNMVEDQKSKLDDKTVIYSRVSTPKQKNDLDTQVERLKSFCLAKGWAIDEIHKEVASGLNDNRPKLNRILSDDTITRVVVENKDRLTRFGFNYIQTMLSQKGVELVVVNRQDEKDTDLIQDFVSIITSMAARVYGARRVANKKIQILDALDLQNSEEFFQETLNSKEE